MGFVKGGISLVFQNQTENYFKVIRNCCFPSLSFLFKQKYHLQTQIFFSQGFTSSQNTEKIWLWGRSASAQTRNTKLDVEEGGLGEAGMPTDPWCCRCSRSRDANDYDVWQSATFLKLGSDGRCGSSMHSGWAQPTARHLRLITALFFARTERDDRAEILALNLNRRPGMESSFYHLLDG